MTKEYTVKNTNISNTLDAAIIDKIRYDNNVKRIFADKQIAARILKYTLDEFKDMDIDDVIACIDGEPRINVCAEPGLTNTYPEQLKTTSSEDNVQNEGIIYFDIRFNSKESMKDEIYRILIDFEGQQITNPISLGYHIENRIVFYICRMISSQKEVEFTHSDFDNLKKVKSIWICMDSKNDSIIRIKPQLEILHGTPDREYHFDQMEGVMINIRNDKKGINESKNTLIAMLEDLLRFEDKETKKLKLQNKYNITMTRNLEGEMNNMNLPFADAYLAAMETRMREDAMDYAMKEATEKVTKEVMKHENNFILNMHNKGFTLEQISLASNKSVEEIENIIKESSLELV